MEIDTAIIKDRFRQHYQLIVNHKNSPHPQAKAVTFWSAESSLRFLYNLDVDFSYWSKVLRQTTAINSQQTFNKPYEAISNLMLHHQIEFYQMPRMQEQMIHNGQDKAFRFLKGPRLNLLDNDISPQLISSEAEAEALLAELDANDEYWQNVISNNDTQAASSEEASSKDVKKQIAALLASGEIIAYQAAYTPAPPQRESPVIEDVSMDSPVLLGPHETEGPVVKKSFKFLISC